MPAADLWQSRTDALEYLKSNQAPRLEVIEEIIDAIDQTIDAYEKRAVSDEYARICGLTLVKGKNLAVGMYSLTLDGLAQEAGALARPFIEYVELLTYFRIFPKKVRSAIYGKLPSAGKRAKAIKGTYQEFRNHLSQHAAHSSYNHFSLSHLLELKTGKFKKTQSMVPSVVDRNIRDITVQVYLLLQEAVLGLEPVNLDAFDLLAGITDDIKGRLIKEFELHADS